jgi:hypothetical protein
MHRLLLTGLLLLLGCGAPRNGVTTRPEPAATVVVEPDGEGRWIATWHLTAPARELRFERPAGGFRARVFEVLTPGYRLERDGDTEVLRASGDAARVIRVRFPEYDRQLTREYEFFRRFSDGSVAIYTGHLIARAMPEGGAAPCDTCFVSSFEFRPPAGSSVVVEGRLVVGSTRWLDPSGRGTYVYIGSIVPVASEDVLSVIDPGLPDWLEARTREAFPRLFALYRDRLGVSPRTRPVVLFDYKPGPASGYESGGGTLPGVIQLGVQGASWERESLGALQRLMHFLGHESAHLWNGEIAHYAGTEDAWMHEGSADALAERALVELGVTGEARLLDYQTEALNDCRQGLAITPLRESARRGQPRLAYTCGNMIALLTEASVQKNGANLFDFWRRLIARAGGHGGSYTADDYRAVWREMGATGADVAALQQFLDGSMDADRLANALRASGVALREAEPPRSFAQALARDTFARLMAADCNGRVGFRTSDTGLLLDDDLACGTLTPGAVLVSLEGFDVLTDGHRAYDAVRSRCEAKSPVTARLSGGATAREVKLGCVDPLPARPAYLEIAGTGKKQP